MTRPMATNSQAAIEGSLLTAGREEVEAREAAWLAPYAVRASESRGRRHDEPPCRWRTIFQRDRDRILHCAAFRRLESKTQVFITRTGDHFRTRLTHSLEVAQVSRSIARILRLNEDLTEAVALAHDLGHTPFGHSGGDTLDELMKDHGGFEHNHQSLRILDELEERYPGFRGLNLAYEVRESIVKHKRPFEGPAYIEYHPEEGPPLEAQLVDLCDGIAYNSHDLDDGLHSGLLEPEQVEQIEIWRVVSERVARKWPDVDGRVRRLKCVSEIIDYLLNDLIRHSARRIEELGLRTLDDVRGQANAVLGFSEDARRQERELRRFLYANLYTHYKVHRMRNRARIFIEGLFAEFVGNPKLLPPRYRERIDDDGLERTVADYVAGMTDAYAQQEYQRLFNPESA